LCDFLSITYYISVIAILLDFPMGQEEEGTPNPPPNWKKFVSKGRGRLLIWRESNDWLAPTEIANNWEIGHWTLGRAKEDNTAGIGKSGKRRNLREN
jgi:hypothetical protein